jgi:hypothetical protein
MTSECNGNLSESLNSIIPSVQHNLSQHDLEEQDKASEEKNRISELLRANAILMSKNHFFHQHTNEALTKLKTMQSKLDYESEERALRVEQNTALLRQNTELTIRAEINKEERETMRYDIENINASVSIVLDRMDVMAQHAIDSEKAMAKAQECHSREIFRLVCVQEDLADKVLTLEVQNKHLVSEVKNQQAGLRLNFERCMGLSGELARARQHIMKIEAEAQTNSAFVIQKDTLENTQQPHKEFKDDHLTRVMYQYHQQGGK